MPHPEPRPNQDRQRGASAQPEPGSEAVEQLTRFKQDARNFVECAYPPELRADFLFASESDLLARRLEKLRDHMGLLVPQSSEQRLMQEQISESLREMLIKGWFSGAAQVISSGLIDPQMLREKSLIRLAAFVCFDQVSEGRSDCVVDVLQELVPGFSRHAAYKHALRDGLASLIYRGSWSEMGYFLFAVPGAESELRTVLEGKAVRELLLSKLPESLPAEVQAYPAAQTAFRTGAYQAGFIEWARKQHGASGIRALVDFRQRYPLTPESVAELRPHVRELIRSADIELRYYASAQGSEYLDNLLRCDELRIDLRHLRRLFGKGRSPQSRYISNRSV